MNTCHLYNLKKFTERKKVKRTTTGFGAERLEETRRCRSNVLAIYGSGSCVCVIL